MTTNRGLFEFLAFTGMRIGEGLGLVWHDIDLDAALIHVHCQLNRHRQHAPLKTPSSERDVGEHFRAAVKRAALTPTGKLIVHSLRHGFVSLLISKGLDVEDDQWHPRVRREPSVVTLVETGGAQNALVLGPAPARAAPAPRLLKILMLYHRR